MTGLARLVVCGTFLVASSSFALADSLTITGNVTFSQDSLTFAPPFSTQNDSGIFAGFGGGTVNYMLGTVQYTQGFYQTTEAFTVTNSNGDVLAFYDQVNSPLKSYTNGNLDVTLDETGYYTFNGGPEMAGTFDLGFSGTSPNGANTYVPFTGTGALISPSGVTPEPSSIALLGTGLLASAGVLKRRRV